MTEARELAKEVKKSKDDISSFDISAGMLKSRAWRAIAELLAETTHLPTQDKEIWSNMARILFDAPSSVPAIDSPPIDLWAITIRPPGYSVDADSVRRLETTSRLLVIEIFVYIENEQVSEPECLGVLEAITDRSSSCNDHVVAYLIRQCGSRFCEKYTGALSTAVGLFAFSLRQLMHAMNHRFEASQDHTPFRKIHHMLRSSNLLLQAIDSMWSADDPIDSAKSIVKDDFLPLDNFALATLPSSKWIILIRLPHEIVAIPKSLFEHVQSYNLYTMEYVVQPAGVLTNYTVRAGSVSGRRWMRRILLYTEDPGEEAKDILAQIEAGTFKFS